MLISRRTGNGSENSRMTHEKVIYSRVGHTDGVAKTTLRASIPWSLKTFRYKNTLKNGDSNSL